MSLGSALEVLVLKNLAECTSQRVKRTSGARLTNTVGRSIARSLDRSIARSLDRSIALVQSGLVWSGVFFFFVAVRVVGTSPGFIFPVWSGAGLIRFWSGFENSVRVSNSGFQLSGPGSSTPLLLNLNGI